MAQINTYSLTEHNQKKDRTKCGPFIIISNWGVSPEDLPPRPGVYAIAFAVPVALANVDEVEDEGKHEDEREEVAQAVHDAGDVLALIVDEGDGGEDVADPHGNGNPDALSLHVVAADDEVHKEDGHGEVHAPGGVGAAHAERIVRRCGGPELILAHDHDEPAEDEGQSNQRVHGLFSKGRIVHFAELQEVVQDDHVQEAPNNVDGALRERARSNEGVVELPRKVQCQGPEGHAMRLVQVSAVDDEDVRDTPAET